MTLGVVGPSAVVLNLALSRYVLKEKAFSPIIVVACGFLVSGSILAIVFANYESEKYEIHKIARMMFKPGSIVLICVTFGS